MRKLTLGRSRSIAALDVVVEIAKLLLLVEEKPVGALLFDDDVVPAVEVIGAALLTGELAPRFQTAGRTRRLRGSRRTDRGRDRPRDLPVCRRTSLPGVKLASFHLDGVVRREDLHRRGDTRMRICLFNVDAVPENLRLRDFYFRRCLPTNFISRSRRQEWWWLITMNW